MIVRPASGDDHAAVAELLTQLGYPTSAEAAATRLRRLSSQSRALVAVAGGEVVGLSTVHRMSALEWDEPSCRMMAVVVRDGHRRRGVGTALVEASERLAAEWGCPRLELTSGNHRAEAHVFYRRLGYRESSRRFVKELPRPGARPR